MNKLILLLALICWMIQPIKAQVIGGPISDPLVSEELILLPITVVSNTPTEKCFRMEFVYKCPDGNCMLGVSKAKGVDAVKANSGSPNVNWQSFSATMCFDKGLKTYEPTIYCQINALRDGAVVVIEGG